jgi:hypothetical protein
MSRRKRWAATLLIAACCAALVPQPAAASHPCHRPVSHTSWQSAEHPCDMLSHAACLAMPGCAAVTAVAAVPDPGLPAPPDVAVLEPQAAVAHDLAPRGPPTPPPNS